MPDRRRLEAEEPMITLTDDPDPDFENILETGLAEYNETWEEFGRSQSAPDMAHIFMRKMLAT
jgi:hypothetical protein